MSNGFSFNIKRLSDFGCFISTREISPPQKKQVLVTVPYKNGSWDFSTLYGGPAFEDRTIKYGIVVIGSDVTSLSTKKQELENWLMSCHRGQLIDDAFPGWYFTAECVSVSESDNTILSELSIEFSAEPFKQSVMEYSAAYTPSAAADVIATNSGLWPVIPTITCMQAATVKYGGNTYALGSGAHTDNTFTLQPGASTFNVTSAGTVTIAWRTEAL